MTRQLPPLVPFSEILRTALGMASGRIVAGSRRNAADALVAGVADTEAASAAFAAWVPAAAQILSPGPVTTQAPPPGPVATQAPPPGPAPVPRPAPAPGRPAAPPRLPRQEPRRSVACRESA